MKRPDLSWIGEDWLAALGIEQHDDPKKLKKQLGYDETKRGPIEPPYTVFPYPRVKGFVRVRQGAEPKYLFTAGKGCQPYFGRLGDKQLEDTSQTLVVCEGEKCCIAAQKSGVVAVGIGGCSGWYAKKGTQELLPAIANNVYQRDVVIALDGDVTSKPSVRIEQWKLAAALQRSGARVWLAPVVAAGQDLEDVYRAQGGAAVRALLQLGACRQVDCGGLLSDLTDQGLAQRFVVEHEHRLRFMRARGGGTWRGTPMGGAAVWGVQPSNRVEAYVQGTLVSFVSRHLSSESEAIAEAASKALTRLRSGSGLPKLLRLVRDGLTLEDPSGFFDQRTDLIAVGDECIETAIGAPVPLTPELRITVQLGPWTARRHNDGALQELLRSMFPDKDIREAFRLQMGRAFGPHYDWKTANILIGPKDCGKTTLAIVLRAAFGDHAVKSSPALLTKGALDGGEKPKSMAARVCRPHVRLVHIDEFADGHKLDEAALKLLTGGDEAIEVRDLNTSATMSQFRGSLLLTTNTLFEWDGGDAALRGRFWVFECAPRPASEPNDPRLRERLLADVEGARQWLLEASLDAEALRHRGIEPVMPDSMVADLTERAEEADDIGRYLEDCMDVTTSDTDRVLKQVAFEVYRKWGGKKGEQTFKPAVSRRLATMGVRQPKGASKVLGTVVTKRQFHGVIVRPMGAGHGINFYD